MAVWCLLLQFLQHCALLCVGMCVSIVSSHASSHTGKALQVSWGKDYAPSFMERWNPFSTTLKVTIFQSHVLFQKAHRSDRHLSLDAFIADLLEVIKQAKGADFEITEGPVWSETYLGVAALVHNQSHLGFNKRRGGLDW